MKNVPIVRGIIQVLIITIRLDQGPSVYKLEKMLGLSLVIQTFFANHLRFLHPFIQKHLSLYDQQTKVEVEVEAEAEVKVKVEAEVEAEVKVKVEAEVKADQNHVNRLVREKMCPTQIHKSQTYPKQTYIHHPLLN
jgi:hypothetical protein